MLSTSFAAKADGATDIKVKKPNVLLLLDTSGSMAWSLDGSDNYDCNAAKGPKKPRWTVLLETLTGSVNNLTCKNASGSYIMAASNGCRPYPNLNTGVTDSLKADPYAWPHLTGTGKDNDAIAFCGPTSSSYAACSSATNWKTAALCATGAGGWDQKSDGLIDTYATQLRFGVASFDSLDAIPGNHRDPALRYDPLNTALGCQYQIDGSICSMTYLDSYKNKWLVNGLPQWSYWHRSASESWTVAVPSLARDSYTDTLIAASDEKFVETQFDIGIRNSRALPARGRLIGFGPSDWSFEDHKLPCANEDDCTRSHNEMVERSILGLSSYLEHSTPLAAMMRDAYEFLHYDDATPGVHVPHDPALVLPKTGSVFGTIGPKADRYFADGARCRSTSVIVVTDGEPTEDLTTPMSHWSGRLFDDEGVRTFVIGVGLDSAKWSRDGISTKSQDCSALTAADLSVDGNTFCARDSASGLFKYADKSPYKSALGVTPAAIRACCTLLETAVEGGTSHPYFPKDQSGLKQELNTVLQSIAGGSVSRTLPVFAPVTASFLQAGTSAAGATGYELRSSMEVSGDDGLWRGHLERVRYTCDDDSSEPFAALVESKKGDRFEANLDVTPSAFRRSFLTVAPANAADASGSLRPSSTGSANAYDGLAPGKHGDFVRLSGDDSAGKDALVAAKDLASSVDALSGAAKIDAILGLKGSDQTSCLAQTGSSDLPTCADRVLRWYGGEVDPDGSATATPSRAAASPQCGQTACSPMGAIYRSSPVVVPPPSAADNDAESYGRTRVDGSESFVDQFGTRPTMAYAQTIDGQLHAFVLSKNDYSGGVFDKQVPDADELSNNELWTFIPPIVMPHLWPSFDVNARLLDGQIAWANVIYDRPTDVDTSTFSYATVMVGASGVSGAGGFYYALDVTDPVKPKFLWQLRASGNGVGGAPSGLLFGDSAPGAAITTIRYREPGEREVKSLAVAVLPGGAPSSAAPSATRSRRMDPDDFWKGDDRKPRSRVRDWGESVPSRSLTFVELKTGRILARMVGDRADNPRDPALPLDSSATSLKSRVVVDPAQTPFDSPLTGIPVAYPVGIGVPATRIYVGDADGTMWRVELPGPDASSWTARIAFDSYNAGSDSSTLHEAWVPVGTGGGGKLRLEPDAEAAALLGQPIQAAPLLSTDLAGDVVVAYATGDQESFSSTADGMVNVLVSFSDPFIDAKYRFQAKVDAASGLELAWRDGGRVTGPLNLADGQLYFAYFNPSSALACTNGTGGLCGIDYLAKKSTGSPVGYVSLDGNDSPDACVDFTAGEVVFGVAVSQVPSCDATTAIQNDPWLGGKYKSRTASKVGRLQLVFQTGQGGESEEDAKTKSTRIDLPIPRSRSRIRSWVTVNE